MTPHRAEVTAMILSTEDGARISDLNGRFFRSRGFLYEVDAVATSSLMRYLLDS